MEIWIYGLAVMSLITFIGALRYWSTPEVKINWGVIGLLTVTASIGVIAGAEIAKHAPAHVPRRVFAVIMVIAAIKLAFFTKPPAAPETTTTTTTTDVIEKAEDAS